MMTNCTIVCIYIFAKTVPTYLIIITSILTRRTYLTSYLMSFETDNFQFYFYLLSSKYNLDRSIVFLLFDCIKSFCSLKPLIFSLFQYLSLYFRLSFRVATFKFFFTISLLSIYSIVNSFHSFTLWNFELFIYST